MKCLLLCALLAFLQEVCIAQASPAPAASPCSSVKIIVEPAARVPEGLSRTNGFGRACGLPSSPSGASDKPVHSPLCELLGSPIEQIYLQRYPGGSSGSRQAVSHLRRVLQARPQDPLFTYIAWAEAVPPGIVAKVKFTDGTETILEESSGHICFTDHAHHTWFTRLNLRALEPVNP